MPGNIIKYFPNFSFVWLFSYSDNNTNLQKKIDEIRLEGDLGFPVRYIFLIKKRALKIFSMVPFFLKCKKRFSHFLYLLLVEYKGIQDLSESM